MRDKATFISYSILLTSIGGFSFYFCTYRNCSFYSIQESVYLILKLAIIWDKRVFCSGYRVGHICDRPHLWSNNRGPTGPKFREIPPETFAPLAKYENNLIKSLDSLVALKNSFIQQWFHIFVCATISCSLVFSGLVVRTRSAVWTVRRNQPNRRPCAQQVTDPGFIGWGEVQGVLGLLGGEAKKNHEIKGFVNYVHFHKEGDGVSLNWKRSLMKLWNTRQHSNRMHTAHLETMHVSFRCDHQMFLCGRVSFQKVEQVSSDHHKMSLVRGS